MNESSFDLLLKLAIREDLSDLGDVTSRAIFSDETCRAGLYSKDTGVLAGSEYYTRVFARLDPDTRVSFHFQEGDILSPGDLVAEVEGKTLSVLTAERIALNFLGYLSGIATVTRRFCELRQGGTRVLDTRKTLPGYRELAKYAVVVGGGTNHRRGLYDMVMIKDNHIDAAGSIRQAVQRVRDHWGGRFKVEVECRNENEVREAVQAGADIIMLDNMSPESAARCLEIEHDGVAVEASGDMTLERIGEYMQIGLDYISVGKLTHSVRNFDFSLKIERDAL
jgi:nicotinate-nucleotide pyrophosphorylase (carboxylating)